MLSEDKKQAIKCIVKRWIKRSFQKLLSLDPAELYPNPFLMRAIGIKEESKEFYEFSVRQRLERSLSTSFGMSVFEGIVRTLNNRAGIEDIDMVITKEGVTYYIQLKSGPQGFTRPALRKTKQSFARLKKQDPEAVTVIGFAYGKRELLSPVWGKEAEESADLVLIGKEFWDFFFGDGTYEELLDLCEKASQEVLEELGLGRKDIIAYVLERVIEQH